LSDWRRVRLDAVAAEQRSSVMPAHMAGREILHYSIPVYDETGGGRVEPGDEIGSSKTRLAGAEVLVSKLNPRKSRVLITEPYDGLSVCSGEFVVLTPRSADGRFLRYVFLSEHTRQALAAQVRSVTRSQQRVDPISISKLWLDLPSLDDQRRIADSLDHETARIDALIKKKQHLLRLVHERRAAFASRILRSLPRDSKLGYLAQWLSGGTPPRDREDLWAGDMPWASSADLGEDLDVLAETAQHVTPSAAREWSRLAPAETILIATRGMSLARRLPAVRITRTMAFNQDLKGVRLLSSMDARFAMAVLQSLEDEILSLIDEAAHGTKRLETARLKALPVPCPPLQTQRRIVATLEGNASRTRRLSEDLRTQAARLSERRQVLITEVVTGQRRIDAPSAVAA